MPVCLWVGGQNNSNIIKQMTTQRAPPPSNRDAKQNLKHW